MLEVPKQAFLRNVIDTPTCLSHPPIINSITQINDKNKMLFLAYMLILAYK